MSVEAFKTSSSTIYVSPIRGSHSNTLRTDLVILQTLEYALCTKIKTLLKASQ